MHEDDDFRFIVNKVPLGATFTMVSDSCHSGGLIDKEKEQIGPVHSRSLTDPETIPRRSSKSKFLPLDSLLDVLREKTGLAKMEPHEIKIALFQLFGDKASSKVKRLVNSNCSVLEAEKGVNKSQRVDDHEEPPRIHEDMGILLSGCQTNETSADACPTGDPNKAYGAFSNAIQAILEQHGKPISNRELVLGTRKLLVEQGYSQHPCLYCSDNNADAAFFLSSFSSALFILVSKHRTGLTPSREARDLESRVFVAEKRVCAVLELHCEYPLGVYNAAE